MIAEMVAEAEVTEEGVVKQAEMLVLDEIEGDSFTWQNLTEADRTGLDQRKGSLYEGYETADLLVPRLNKFGIGQVDTLGILQQTRSLLRIAGRFPKVDPPIGFFTALDLYPPGVAIVRRLGVSDDDYHDVLNAIIGQTNQDLENFNKKRRRLNQKSIKELMRQGKEPKEFVLFPLIPVPPRGKVPQLETT